MMSWGTSAPSVLLSTWYSNNNADENQRILISSIGVPLGNVMGLVSSNIFRERDAPKYQLALIITAIFGAVGLVLALAQGLYMLWDNYRRNAKQGCPPFMSGKDIPTTKLQAGPGSWDFRWVL